jgi:hypothetical protein
MAEYLKATHTYDLTKNIKDLEINTGFILGLDAILLFYIGNVVEDPSTLPATFKKFEAIIKGEATDENPIELDYVERQLYTLFALQQLLKAKAKEQNLEIELESKVTEADMLDYMKAAMNGEDEKVSEKLSKIQELIKPKLS